MIAEIFLYIPDQLTVGLVCKKFHEISCYIKLFKLSLHRYFERNKIESESEQNEMSKQEEEIFESMIISERRINRLCISCPYKFDNDKHFMEIVEHFGRDIKQLDMSRVQVNHNFLDFLNLMPNLVKINLNNVNGDVSLNELKLKLNKLKEVQSSECPAEILEVFNALPPGVLEKVELMWYPSEENDFHENHLLSDINLFKNQQNIKEITAHSYLNFINFKQLKLTSLLYEDFSSFRLQEQMQGQNKLTSLSSHSFQDGDLKFICNELKSLVLLNGAFYNISSSEFSEISKLKKLKNLRVSWIAGGFVDDKVNESLFVMQSESLTDLEINCDKVMNSAVAQLGVNCPNLQRFNLETKASFNTLNMIIKNFKNLRCLVFRGGPDEDDRNFYDAEALRNDCYVFRQDLRNRKLRKLNISGWCEDYQDLPKLISCCINLKVFKTTLYISPRMLQKILLSNLKLEKLHLFTEFRFDNPQPHHKVSHKTIEILKKVGKKLHYFYCEFKEFEKGLTEELLIENCKQDYALVEVKKDCYNFLKLELQRS